MLAVVLQARINSSRLPGKSLLPLGGRPLVFRVMEALNQVPADLRVLACPEDCAQAFGPLAVEAGFILFTGPRDDVLQRYCLAIRRFNIDRLIRATGDNPFVFADAAAALNAEAMSLNADYAGYSGLPPGAGIESVDAAALLRAGAEAAAPFDREHVCPYLYGRPERFLLHRPLAPRRWQNRPEMFSARKPLRLTVDTPDDYERAQKIFSALDRFGSGERCRGAEIIKVCDEIFSSPDSGESP
ncbi:MAG: NTP transferase domain-containing protein [Treponema sp.]|jgi:spore coat polysaccharide biosynthesis protein SpsF|nr:NTP transferase domain-containing protein [Treponema sp.]